MVTYISMDKLKFHEVTIVEGLPAGVTLYRTGMLHRSRDDVSDRRYLILERCNDDGGSDHLVYVEEVEIKDRHGEELIGKRWRQCQVGAVNSGDFAVKIFTDRGLFDFSNNTVNVTGAFNGDPISVLNREGVNFPEPVKTPSSK